MKCLFSIMFNNIDLTLNIIGTFFIAFSFGKNIENAHQTRINIVTRKEEKVYLASFLHPLLFKIGCGLLISGFIITLLRR